jgi:hypothetical protein
MALIKVNFFSFHGFSTESQIFCTNISANLQKNVKVFLVVHQGASEVLIQEKN